MKDIVIIDYGAGNIFSVQKAIERLGFSSTLSADPDRIRKASHIVFPGVGHAKSAMNQLQNAGLVELIPSLKQPVIGICLGMQLLCAFSEEGEVRGLGVFPQRVKEFPKNEIVPHMGWNDVVFANKPELSGAYYFVHSYYAEIGQETWARGVYSLTFSAALQKDNFYGVQFHPEKSGSLGEKLLNEFLKL